jgi:hypothetical protein
MATEPSVTMPESEFQSLTARAKANAVVLAKEGPTSNKTLMLTIAAAAGGFWLLQSDAIKKIEVFAKHWYLKGLLLLAAGYWLWKKKNPWWGIVVGLGATTLAMDYKAHRDEAERKKPAGGETHGVEEAGAPLYDWQVGSDGRAAFGPRQHNDLADQMAGRVFQTG